MARKILITGAGGHLGGRLYDHLDTDEGFDVSGLDLRPGNRPNVIEADFTRDGPWVERLVGVDTVVHLAGDREPNAGWDSAISNNIDGTLRLYHHAAERGVKRVILASSNWLHGGHRFGTDTLTPDLEPRPVNAYGVSKLCCERAGAYFAQYRGLSVICMRIGWTQWTHDNKPGPHMAMGRWGQDMWLSDRDYLQGMTAAINAENVNFAILNLMSDNDGMRWDIETTKRVIGYAPQDSHRAVLSLKQKVQAPILRFLTTSLPRFVERRMADW